MSLETVLSIIAGGAAFLAAAWIADFFYGWLFNRWVQLQSQRKAFRERQPSLHRLIIGVRPSAPPDPLSAGGTTGDLDMVSLGIWLALMPLLVFQAWKGRRGRRGMPWLVLVLRLVVVGGSLVGCGKPTPTPTPPCTPPTPSFVSLTATYGTIDLGPHEGYDVALHFGTRTPNGTPTPDRIPGAFFEATINIPANTKGWLHFTQLMMTKRSIEFVGGGKLKDASGARPVWWKDGSDPYNYDFEPIEPQGSAWPATVLTEDSPYVAPNGVIAKYEHLYNINDTPKKLIIDDDFIMYISWNEQSGILDRQVLGKVEWGWYAEADFDASTEKWILGTNYTKPPKESLLDGVVYGVATSVMENNNEIAPNEWIWES